MLPRLQSTLVLGLLLHLLGHCGCNPGRISDNEGAFNEETGNILSVTEADSPAEFNTGMVSDMGQISEAHTTEHSETTEIVFLTDEELTSLTYQSSTIEESTSSSSDVDTTVEQSTESEQQSTLFDEVKTTVSETTGVEQTSVSDDAGKSTAEERHTTAFDLLSSSMPIKTEEPSSEAPLKGTTESEEFTIQPTTAGNKATTDQHSSKAAEITTEESTPTTSEPDEGGTETTEMVTQVTEDGAALEWWAILLICLGGAVIACVVLGLVIYLIKRQRQAEMYAHELLTYDPPMKDYINGSQAVAFNSADPLDVDDIIAQPQRSDGLVKGEEDGLVTTGDSSYNSFANPTYDG